MYVHLSAVDAIVNVLGDHVCPVTSCPANHASVDRTSGQIVAVYGAANNGGGCDREVIDTQNPGAVTTLNPSSIGTLALLTCSAQPLSVQQNNVLRRMFVSLRDSR